MRREGGYSEDRIREILDEREGEEIWLMELKRERRGELEEE